MSNLPLSRFTVLDLTAHRSGPTCVRQLADWGANVIKIVGPGAAEKDAIGSSPYNSDPQNLHRNKRNMTLNLKSDEGREIFFKLVEKADVIVENYRSDVKSRLGIDYEATHSVNPRIVYGSISGFGQDGPYGNRPGVDQIAQGLGGLMSITGLPGQGPVRVGIPITDLTSGLLLAQGILMALLDREVSGIGQWVRTSLLEAQIFMLDFQAARWLVDGEVAQQAGNDHPTGIPMGVFPTSDGHINIAAAGGAMWIKLCKAIERSDLVDNPDYATGEMRSKNRVTLNALISEITSKKPSDHWEYLMNKAGIPCGPINDIGQVFADPQVKHLGMAVPVAHPVLGAINLVGQPIKMSGNPEPQYRAAAENSQHTDEILTELGYNAEQISKLAEQGAV